MFSSSIVTGSAKLQNLKANHNTPSMSGLTRLIVTGSAKLQNLKANHNIADWSAPASAIVTGSAKLQNLKGPSKAHPNITKADILAQVHLGFGAGAILWVGPAPLESVCACFVAQVSMEKTHLRQKAEGPAPRMAVTCAIAIIRRCFSSLVGMECLVEKTVLSQTQEKGLK